MEPIEFRPDDIRAARERIGPYVRRTPVLELAALLAGALVAEPSEHVVVLVCGANGDLSAIASPVRRAPDLRRTLP
jgi:threonine dehydratase